MTGETRLASRLLGSLEQSSVISTAQRYGLCLSGRRSNRPISIFLGGHCSALMVISPSIPCQCTSIGSKINPCFDHASTELVVLYLVLNNSDTFIDETWVCVLKENPQERSCSDEADYVAVLLMRKLNERMCPVQSHPSDWPQNEAQCCL